MDEHSNINSKLVALALSVLSAIFIYFEASDGLRTHRPKDAAACDNAVLVGDQGCVARLWQDPMSLLESRKARKSLDEMRAQISRRMEQAPPDKRQESDAKGKDGKTVRVVAMFVDGYPYAEDVEVRLRMRHAIQRAFLDCGYMPYDRNHIGIFSLRWPTGRELLEVVEQGRRDGDLRKHAESALFPLLLESGGDDGRLRALTLRALFGSAKVEATFGGDAAKAGKTLDIPFEWMRKDKENVLLLWLREEEFTDFPLLRLVCLARALAPGAAGQPKLNVVGPRSSNTLLTMGEEADTTRPDGCWKDMGISIYSPEATAPDAKLYGDTRLKDRVGTKKRLKAVGVAFHNLICTDDKTAECLVEELRLRSVGDCPGRGVDKIVLVSEADTFFGHSLQECFAEACKAGQDKVKILSFNYLRGLDGVPADEAVAKGKDNSPKGLTENAARLGLMPEMILAEGSTQTDYICRLVNQIKEATRLKNFCFSNRQQPCAIGILGSDIYDKILLLQVLKPQFRDSVFFTTDMDARYLNANTNKLCRNLIVASAYGLSPQRLSSQTGETDKNGGTPEPPSFRDSYQTAVYLGCKSILNGSDAQVSNTPHVYEIGRSEAFDLMPQQDESNMCGNVFAICLILLIPLVIWLLCFSGLVFARTSKASEEELEVNESQYNHVLGWTAFFFVVLVLFSSFAIYHAIDQKGEPFAMFAGISAWPTMYLRLIAIWLSGCFIVIMWHQYRKNQLFLTEEFFRGTEPSKAGSGRHCSLLRGWIPTKHTNEVDAHHLFEYYQECGTLRRRVLRACALSAAFIAFVFALLFAGGLCVPSSPLRGQETAMVNSGILYIAIGAYCFLAFYTLDAVFLARKMITELAMCETVWPKAVLARFGERHPIKLKQLDGYVDVLFTGAQTKAVHQLFFCPAVILLLLIMARFSVFDNWTWSPLLITIFIFFALLVIACAVILRNAANDIRKDALRQLEGYLHSLDSDKKGAALEKERTEAVIKEIEAIRTGAYAPLPQSVMIIATLIPTGGAGLLALLGKFIS